MTKIRLLTLALLSLASPSAAQDHDARAAFAAMRCDITDERTIEWAAIGQKVTLKTTMSKTAKHDYPTGQLLIILGDGTEIDLGRGSKYIDDARTEILTDCQKHLDVAIAETVFTLSETLPAKLSDNIYVSVNKGAPKTLESLWAYSALGQDCMDENNLPEEGPSAECIRAASYHEVFIESLETSGLSREDFIHLRDNNAPLLTVTRSTYYTETYVYDARDNKIYPISTDGC